LDASIFVGKESDAFYDFKQSLREKTRVWNRRWTFENYVGDHIIQIARNGFDGGNCVHAPLKERRKKCRIIRVVA
jgi:hypothetical protein